ncbi:MAG: mannitol dehydrogenase [Clostridiales bacterium]|jgi:mannitol-1-phosphate 5-dehydrogenase|nr:mannitol dehydrogenase [Clostridiales bacterium]
MEKAVIFGAGNIGRGFIGQLFSESGYEVVFVDINPVIIDSLNRDGGYPIRIVADDEYTEVMVKNVRGVRADDTAGVIEEIASAHIMATAVGVGALPKIARPIALGLKKRWEFGNFSPLNIVICENLINADDHLARLIEQELQADEIGCFKDTVGLVEASIGRMVPVITEAMQEGNPLRVWVEPYCELPVDKAGFKGQIPLIKNMLPFEPFDFFIQRKLFMHNMGHAITAYLGYLYNRVYIWEAIRLPIVKLFALRALVDSAAALSREHNVPMQQLVEHAEDLLYRFGNRLLGDTVDRVGRDPARKLSENDRLVGAARLCIKHGIKPVYMALGIAAGIMFAPAGDDGAQKVQDILNQKGIDGVLRDLCRLTDALEPFAGMTKEFYQMLRAGTDFYKILETAERMKRI